MCHTIFVNSTFWSSFIWCNLYMHVKNSTVNFMLCVNLGFENSRIAVIDTDVSCL